MALAAPAFLAALALLGLPLWLHLLKRHRSEPLPFSSLMFFEQSLQADLRHRRLDYLLLLALRLLLLLAIVFAFAQPYLRRPPVVLHGARLVVLDTSASMAAAGRFADAKRQASALLTPGGRLALFDDRLHLVPATELDAAKPTARRGALAELAGALRALEQAENQPLEVHLLSDLQKSAMPPGFADLALGPRTRLVLHSVGQPEPNWTILSVEAPARVRSGQARLRATVAGFQTPAAKRSIALEINGKIAARQTVDLPENGRATVEFRPNDLPFGPVRAAVLVEEADALPLDNRRWVALQRAEPRRVLFLTGPQAAASADYFPNALQAAAPDAYAVETHPATPLPELKDAAFVVLSDPGAVDEAALRSYLKNGGSVLALPGPATAARGQLLDLKIRGSRFTPNAFRTLEAAPGARFRQTIDLDPGPARVLTRFSDQTPALLEQRFGAGLLLVFASPLDNLASDLPTVPAFLPFADQLATRLAALSDAPKDLAVGTAVPLDNAHAQALDPAGRRALSFEQAAAGQPLELAEAGLWTILRGQDRIEILAANADPRESDLAPMAAESAELWQRPAPAAAAGGFAEEQRLELGPWLLAAALAFALVEAAAAARHLGKEPAHERP